jgi:soluble cytochrome b562
MTQEEIYTMQDWRNDKSLKVQIGQYIDEEVFEQLLDSIPPITYSRGIFQPGEAYDHNMETGEPLYQTFVKNNDLYQYVGLCQQGKTTDESEFSMGNYYRNNNMQENKKIKMKKQIKLTESDLQNIIKESVNQILREREENLEEGAWNTAKSFVGQYLNRGTKKAQDVKKEVGKKVREKYEKVRDGIQDGYDKIKDDIQQTARNARQDSSIKEMQKAFNNFKNAVNTYRQNGGQTTRQLNSYLSAIDKMINNYERHF